MLRLDNETEVVARIPFPISGPPHLLTASEVATLDFVRNVMSIPVPKVLTWSSRADSTPVGTEFIILEKVEGIQLPYALSGIQKVGDKVDDVLKLLSQMLDTDKKFADLCFTMYGSLFYREDVAGYPHTTKILADESQENELTQKFAIGPHLSWCLWRDERKHMDVDRGPCEFAQQFNIHSLTLFSGSTASEYVTGLIRCQQEWLRRFAQPRRPEDPTYRSAENNDPQKHIEALNKCLEAIQIAMPPQLAWPAIWHPDLHRGNIFVTKDPPHMLSGIIDWQFAGIGPFFHQVKVPKAFRYNGTRVKPIEGTVNVTLPDNFDHLPEDEKQLVIEEKFDACVDAMYKAATKLIPNMHALLTRPEFPIMMEPFTSAFDSWDRGLEELQFHLLVLSANWNSFAEEHEECPMQYTDEDRSRILRNFRRYAVYQKNFVLLCDKLGCDGYDCVREEIYDAVWTAIKQLKAEWDAEECGGPYPFEIEQQ